METSPTLRRLALALTAVAVLLGIKANFPADFGLDYQFEAGPAISRLIVGDFGGFAQRLPIMGPVSLYLRAPFALATPGNDLYTVYAMTTLPCFAALLVFGRRLAALARQVGQADWVIGVCVLLCIVNATTFRAIHWGHPEELLASVLTVGAMLVALRARAGWAGALLGLAIATKLWAVIAIPPVLLAANSRQMRTLVVALAVAGLMYVPTTIAAPQRFAAVVRAGGDPQAFAGKEQGEKEGRILTTPSNVWWPAASKVHVSNRGRDVLLVLLPRWVMSLSHALIVVLAVPLAYLYRRSGPRPGIDAFALLALLMLLRCMLDPGVLDYYHVPLVMTLAAWEAIRERGRPPWATLAVTIGCGVAFFPYYDGLVQEMQFPWINPVYLAWAIPLAVWLTARVVRPAGVPAAAV